MKQFLKNWAGNSNPAQCTMWRNICNIIHLSVQNHDRGMELCEHIMVKILTLRLPLSPSPPHQNNCITMQHFFCYRGTIVARRVSHKHSANTGV